MTSSVEAAVGEVVDTMVGAQPASEETAPATMATAPTVEETKLASTISAKELIRDTQKQLLVKLIAQRGNVSQAEARAWFDTVFAVVADAIVLLSKVTITGFGTFRAKEIKARIGRNPRTGEAVNIPKSVRLSFKAGKTTKATLQAAAGGSPAKKERIVSAQDDVKKARAAVKKAVAKKVKKAIVKKAVKKVVKKQTAKKAVRKKAGKAKK
ncbi:MAG TPA: HU family DNA-binding protein [Smithellaceae bacterium]|nr:HU family DNA-binding protein [Smithellaceae bacterium]